MAHYLLDVLLQKMTAATGELYGTAEHGWTSCTKMHQPHGRGQHTCLASVGNEWCHIPDLWYFHHNLKKIPLNEQFWKRYMCLYACMHLYLCSEEMFVCMTSLNSLKSILFLGFIYTFDIGIHCIFKVLLITTYVLASDLVFECTMKQIIMEFSKPVESWFQLL